MDEMSRTGRQFNPDQQRRALALLESQPWEDIDGAVRTFEDALRRAMEATRRDFREWERDLGPRLEHAGGWDEFTLPDENINGLSCEEKLAYVARLLRTLAMMYGVTTDYIFTEASLVAGEDPNSPAAILRGLNDITWMP
jgi:hypothetical protein